jgi:hypothetical protein
MHVSAQITHRYVDGHLTKKPRRPVVMIQALSGKKSRMISPFG